ncbi:MAG: DUF3798 domain-containing protein [Deltaproteobacteria bacterium]|jgi:hypothetical protein|nr:DUF3798 domain-containing protein [Deltaproteobacteria bacterium]
MEINEETEKKRVKLLIVLAAVLAVVGVAAIYIVNSPSPDLDSPRFKRTFGPGSSEAPEDEAVIAETPKFSWRIGLVTSSSAQGDDGMVGVNEALKLYGDARNGGLIKLATYPENFLAEIEATKLTIESLAEDPLVKAICVLEGVPGTTEAFKRIRARRPEIFLVVSETHEETEFIASVADMVVNADFIARGYLIPYAAKKLGARSFVHVSFPRHMIDESLSRTRDIMELACEDLGLAFHSESSLDPTAPTGVKVAMDFIAERVPKWLEQYGPNTAFYATNNAQTIPMIEQIVKLGGYFVEADESSPLLGFPEALDVDVSQSNLDLDKVVKDIEEEIKRRGASGRLGSWVSSLNYSHALALVEFCRLVVEGKIEKRDVASLLKRYESVNPKVRWNGTLYNDASLKTLNNVFLIYQDTYVFGLGFLGLTDVSVPMKYRTARRVDFKTAAKPTFHIVLVTGDEDQGAEDLVVAREIIGRYGSVTDGGVINHVVYPTEFLSDEEATATMIEKLAEDPMVKVIVVNQAIPGTAEGFRRVGEKRPDVFRLAGEPFEPSEVIAANADLAVAGDSVAKGYVVPYQAKALGAKKLVHVSFPRHLALESLNVQLKVMREASKDLGLEFAQETAPDPADKAGVESAQKFILDNYPKWLEKYGKETAFYVTNDAHTEPLIKKVAELGGYFIEADIPSPLLGYPGAFNLDLSQSLGQWQAILEIVEKAVVEAGGSGRLGVWAYPLGYTETAGLVEFGKLLAEGRTQVADINAFLACMGAYTPGARWNGSFLNDPQTGKPLRNFFQIYEDTYIFGRGFIETTKLDIPDKYYEIKADL